MISNKNLGGNEYLTYTGVLDFMGLFLYEHFEHFDSISITSATIVILNIKFGFQNQNGEKVLFRSTFEVILFPAFST